MIKTKKRAMLPLGRGTKVALRNTLLLALALPCALMASRAEAVYSFVLTTTANPVQVGQEVELTATLTDTVEPPDPGLVLQIYGPGPGPLGSPLCASVPVTFIAPATIVARCIISFDTSGALYVIAAYNNFLESNNVILLNVTDPVPFDANQFALTGSWYNPATSGQGLELAVYPDGIADGQSFLFGGWFTYDDAGNPQWVTLQGNLADSHGSSYDLGIYLNRGGNFDAPPATMPEADGTATLTFYDCTHATLAFNYLDGRTGTIPYVRLTSPSGCTTAVPADVPMPLPADYNDVLHSGEWYDPATSGQGLSVDIVPSQSTFFAAWYTFAPAFEGLTGVDGQRWFTLQSNDYTPGDLTLTDVPITVTSGGVFNTPSDVTREVVGTANVTFTSCSTMTLDYNFTEGEFAGLSGSIDEINPAPPAGCE